MGVTAWRKCCVSVAPRNYQGAPQLFRIPSAACSGFDHAQLADQFPQGNNENAQGKKKCPQEKQKEQFSLGPKALSLFFLAGLFFPLGVMAPSAVPPNCATCSRASRASPCAPQGSSASRFEGASQGALGLNMDSHHTGHSVAIALADPVSKSN